MPHVLDEHRQDRDEDDANRDQREVFLDERHVPEQPSRTDAQTDPGCRPDHVVEDEGARRHLRRTGHERHERAHDRHESAENDRLPAVQLEERVSALEMTGTTESYYAVLKSYGYEHADAISNDEEARGIYKALLVVHNTARADNLLRSELELAESEYGPTQFYAVLGANGAETIEDVMGMDSEHLAIIRRELKALGRGITPLAWGGDGVAWKLEVAVGPSVDGLPIASAPKATCSRRTSIRASSLTLAAPISKCAVMM